MKLHDGDAVLEREVELEHEEVDAAELELGQRALAIGRLADGYALLFDQRAQRVPDVGR